MDIARLLREPAEAAPQKVALVWGPKGSAETITYDALDREVDRVAAGLVAAGVAPGDRVAIGMHNVVQFPMAYFGILRAGAVVVPMNVMLTEVEAHRVLVDSGAKAVLTVPPFSGVVQRAVVDTEVEKVFTPDNWDELGKLGKGFDDVARSEEDLAVLAYTSGTTGEPKGAMLTQGNLLANLRQQMSIPDMTVEADDVLFLALPLFHIFGLNVGLGLLVLNGASGVLVDKFDPIPSLRLIHDHRVSILFGAPTMYSAWVSVPGADQYDLSSVRLAISGAAPLAADVLRDFRDIFGVSIYEGYGLTETAPTLMSNRMAEKPRAGSIGKPLPEVEYKLVDEDGNEVALGDPGEIVVRGPNVFSGYWKRPEDTERAFAAGGWFRTGDIAVRDEDGYLYLVDRKRDLIIVSGFNVFPSEVENALIQNPKVEEAAVLGTPHPYTGEAVKAFVVLADGVTASENDLIDDVQSRLARFKCPSSIEIVEKLPHLATGKVLKRALRT
ncbi:MAG: long-chain-fatty-acid--CoA ligase [Actinomycetota bacterium]